MTDFEKDLKAEIEEKGKIATGGMLSINTVAGFLNKSEVTARKFCREGVHLKDEDGGKGKLVKLESRRFPSPTSAHMVHYEKLIEFLNKLGWLKKAAA